MTNEEKIRYANAIRFKQMYEDRRNEVFESVRKFKGRYVILIGGSGSGKSYEIADRVLERVKEADNARILCVRAEQKQVAKSQFPLLWSRTPFYKCFERVKSQGNERIYNGDKGEVIFSGLDDVDKLKSVFDITSIWIEEGDQVLAADVRELNRRLRGYQGLMQIYITFNPVSNLNYINKMFFSDRLKEVITKDDEGNKKTVWIDRTLTIRGQQEFENFPYYKDDPITEEMFNRTIETWDDEINEGLGGWVTEMYYTTLLVHSTYRDNKFIDLVYRQVMAKLRIDDPEEAKIYCDGQWGISGGTYFDKHNINKRILDNIKPIKKGYFDYDYINHEIIESSIKWIDDEDGYIKIFNEPIAGYPYVLSGDTAGDGSDWNTGCMTDNTTGEDVASLRINFDEDLYARQMYCLGKWYGELNQCNEDALIGLEINHSSHPNKEIIRMGYKNIYIREQQPDSISEKLVFKYGFRTTGTSSGGGTRPIILSMLRTVVREEPHLIKDIDTLNEMTTFAKNDKGKPEAIKGFHDDMILARAINCYIRDQQPRTVKRVVEEETYKQHVSIDGDNLVEEFMRW